MKTNRKADLYEAAGAFGREASFVANVILGHHRNPVKKLAGLLALLNRGAEVRTGQFAIDVLVIDGRQADWSSLENVK